MWTWPPQHAPSRGWSYYVLSARISGRFMPLPSSLKHHFPLLLPHSGHYEAQSGMYRSKQKLQLSCKDPLVDSDAWCCYQVCTHFRVQTICKFLKLPQGPETDLPWLCVTAESKILDIPFYKALLLPVGPSWWCPVNAQRPRQSTCLGTGQTYMQTPPTGYCARQSSVGALLSSSNRAPSHPMCAE